MIIEKNICHICLEDIINVPSRNNKSCCSSKAYICNKCWDGLLENKDTTKCPICKIELPLPEDIRSQDIRSQDIWEYSAIIGSPAARRDILMIHPPPLNHHSLKLMDFIKIIGLMLFFTLMGFITFNIGLLSFKTQDYTLMDVVIFPMFWILMLLSGFFVTIVMLICYYNCCKCYGPEQS